MGEVKMLWVRQPDGEYRCDLLGHRYEIMKGVAFPWVLSRDGSGVSHAPTLAEAKKLGVQLAQRDNAAKSDDRRAIDITDLAGQAWPWLPIYVPDASGPQGRWYALNTRSKVLLFQADETTARDECRKLNEQ